MRGSVSAAVSGEIVQHLLAEEAAVEMRVYLSRRDFLVAQHHLYRTQRGSALQQMRGETMAEGVRRDFLADFCTLGIDADIAEDGHPRQMLAAREGDEEDVFILRNHIDRAANIKPPAYLLCSRRRDGDHALLVALANDTDEAFGEKKIAEPQGADLADAKPTAVEHLDDAMVALTFGLLQIDGGLDAVNLFHGQHCGEMARQARTFEQLRGVLLYHAVELEKAEEGAYAAEHPRYGTGGGIGGVEGFGILMEVGKVSGQHIAAFALTPFYETLHVVLVGIAGVGREALLQQDILPIAVVQCLIGGIHHEKWMLKVCLRKEIGWRKVTTNALFTPVLCAESQEMLGSSEIFRYFCLLPHGTRYLRTYIMKYIIINGPNLNLLGQREPGIYGSTDMESVVEELRQRFAPQGVEIAYYQSNHEGDLIDCLHQAWREGYDGVVLNAGAYTHTSIALHDAIRAIAPLPVVEVHISNVHQRENFRHASLISAACCGVICGFGTLSYRLGIEALTGRTTTL